MISPETAYRNPNFIGDYFKTQQYLCLLILQHTWQKLITGIFFSISCSLARFYQSHFGIQFYQNADQFISVT